MHRYFRLFYLLIISSVLFPSVAFCSEKSQSSKRILLLCSYDAAFPTYPKQMAGLRSILNRADYNIEVEFIDSKRIPGVENLEIFKQNFRFKLSKLAPYDLVIAADDNALKLIEELGDELFPDQPVIFLGVNDRERGLALGKRECVTGVLERPSYQDSIDMMHLAFPQAKEFYVIFDGLPSSLADWNGLLMESEMPEGVTLKPLDLSKMSFDRLYARLAGLTKGDPVLLLSAYLDDEGTALNFERSVSELVGRSVAPIFHLYEHGIGDGLFGGIVVSHFVQAQKAAQIAKRIFNGEAISKIPVVEESPNRYLIDYTKLKEYSLDQDRFSDETVYVNPQWSFWRAYRFWIIFAVCCVIVLLTAVASFFALWRRQRRISCELRESEIRNNTLFENPFAIMLVVFPPTGRIVNSNEAAERFYGYTKKEFQRLSVYDLNVLTKESVVQAMENASKDGGTSVQFQHRMKNGEIRSVEISSGPVLLNKTVHLFSIIKDRTEEIAWECTLLDAKKTAEEANQAKDTFLSMMSHEMRTPLNPIIGFSDMLISTSQDEDRKELLMMIKEAALRLETIIDDVLEFRKLSAGTNQVTNTSFLMSDLIDRLVRLYRMPRNGNRLVVESFSDQRAMALPDGLTLFGPADFLDRIIFNLLCNAFKYTKDGVIYLRIGICKEVEDRVLLLVEVEDTGEGIPEDKLKAIFEPFNQVDSSFSRMYDGVGLGLTICREIADLMGAELTVESEYGKGTRFLIRTWMDRTGVKAESTKVPL